jgi:hypothetical protein
MLSGLEHHDPDGEKLEEETQQGFLDIIQKKL